MTRVLLAGMSTRAAAESAARAGFDVTAIDAFADLDQHPAVRALSLPRDFGVPATAHAAARAARSINCDAVAYLSSFENHLAPVSKLSAGRALWGNPPDVLRRVRDPLLLADTLRRRGLAAPNVNVSENAPNDPNGENDPNGSNEWLVKPLASGGGHGVREWRAGMRLPRRCYLQQFIDGTPGSIVFVAAGGRALPLGVTRQLIGEAAFAASDYRYGGNILGPAGDPQFERNDALINAACELACVVVDEFGLVGVNGIDFIARDGVPYAIEVNPRWCASMELVERAYGVSVFGAHAGACAGGALPDFDLVRARQGTRAFGKAIIFARHDLVIADTRGWLADSTVRDIPRPGERIPAGHPVCTVFAAARDSSACHAALVDQAERVYRELAQWERDVA